MQRLAIILDSCADQIDDDMQAEAEQIKRLAQTEFEWNNQAGIGEDIVKAVKKILHLPPVQVISSSPFCSCFSSAFSQGDFSSSFTNQKPQTGESFFL